MTETTNLNGRLEAFVNSLLQETNLSPTAIARKFSSFHKLSSPPDYRSVIDAGFDFVKHFELADNMPPELRGFHSIYNGHVQIVLKNHERTGAMLHTILHEIFEIIITKLNEKKVPPYKLTHYKTNLFAASVLMPKEVFFEFALKSDLDFLTIHNHEKYIHLSLQSLLLRLSYLFGLNKISYFGVIAENKKANYHQNYPLDRNAFNNFEMNTIVRSVENYVVLMDKKLREFLSKCHKEIIAQKDERKKSITLEEGKEGYFLVKASPFMYGKHGAIKRIVMQVIPRKHYEILLNKVLKKS